jgi:hypothetical protein
MAATDVVFQGFSYAAGYTLSVSVCGLDCGDYVVPDDGTGTVTVPINSDPDKNFNGAYLKQFDVGPFDRVTYGESTTRIDMADGNGGVQTIFVPVVIGFTYPSYGVPLRAVGEDQTKTQEGPALGDLRRTHWFAALLRNTQGISFGTENGTWYPALLAGADQFTPLPKNVLYSGVWSRPLDDGSTMDSFVGWNVTRPYACSVVSLNRFLETSEL